MKIFSTKSATWLDIQSREPDDESEGFSEIGEEQELDFNDTHGVRIIDDLDEMEGDWYDNQ